MAASHLLALDRECGTMSKHSSSGRDHWLDTPLWVRFGDQGFEYLDLSRCWQVLLTVGLFHLGGHHLPRYSGAAAR